MRPSPFFDLHSLLVRKFDLAVKTVTAQIYQAPAALVDLGFDVVVYFARPILGVGGDDQSLVAVEIDTVEMKLSLGVKIVGEALAFEPGEESPLGRQWGR